MIIKCIDRLFTDLQLAYSKVPIWDRFIQTSIGIDTLRNASKAEIKELKTAYNAEIKSRLKVGCNNCFYSRPSVYFENAIQCTNEKVCCGGNVGNAHWNYTAKRCKSYLNLFEVSE